MFSGRWHYHTSFWLLLPALPLYLRVALSNLYHLCKRCGFLPPYCFLCHLGCCCLASSRATVIHQDGGLFPSVWDPLRHRLHRGLSGALVGELGLHRHLHRVCVCKVCGFHHCGWWGRGWGHGHLSIGEVGSQAPLLLLPRLPAVMVTGAVWWPELCAPPSLLLLGSL